MAKQSKMNYLRLDKIPRTGHSESAVHGTETLLAGHFVKLGAVIESVDRELVEATIATEGGDFDALIAPVYIDKGYVDFDIAYESVPAGTPARALIVQKGDIVSLNKGLAEDVSKGDDVEVGADGLGVKTAESGTVIGKCIDVEFDEDFGELVVIRFA